MLTRIAELYRTELDTAVRRRKAIDAMRQAKRMQAQVAAMIYLRLGAKDEFYQFLERLPKGDGIFWETPVYDELRTESRFIELSKRIKGP